MTLSRSDGQSARPLAPSPIQRPAELESHLAEPRPAPRFYKPELDVLRFFAFLFVFLHHTVPNEAADYATKLRPDIAEWVASVGRAGALGVDLFFALSSYLITELLLREAELSGTLDVKAFYIRRILRIWPLYFFFLTLSAAVVPRIIPGDQLPVAYLLMFVFLLGNWMCAFQGYPSSTAAPLWSVSMEEQFYLGWPLLLRVTGARKLAKLCVALLIVASAYRLALVALRVAHPATWCMTFSRLDPIAAGALVAVWLRRRPCHIGLAHRAPLVIAGFLCWLLVARYLPIDNPPTVARALVGYPAITLGAVLMLLAFTAGWKSRLPRALRLPPLIYLGRISYGLYVYHLLAIHLTPSLFKRSIQHHLLPLQFVADHLWSLRFVAGLALTIVLASLSFHFLEQPFLRLKARFTHVLSR